jgi:hypothetical protein
MPVGSPPTTHADGLLTIFYGSGTETHEVSIYKNTVGHGVATVGDATAWANVVAPALSTRYSITGWRWTPFGVPPNPPVPFGAPIAGTDAGGGLDSASWTYTMSGRGTPASVGDASGKCRVVLVPGRAIGVTAGLERVAGGLNAHVDAIVAFLNDATKNVVNKYGQSAIFYAGFTVQFNARLQQKRGT